MPNVPSSLNKTLIRHLNLAIRMILNAIDICPDDVWAKADGNPPIWQHVLHTAYYIQKWIRTSEQAFDPPAFADFAAVDFTAPAEPALDKATLREYVQKVAENSRRLLESADEELLTRRAEINDGEFSLIDCALGQIRHIGYHVGCISTILFRYTGEPLPYISTKEATE
jgi:hypothetical protein